MFLGDKISYLNIYKHSFIPITKKKYYFEPLEDIYIFKNSVY
jgi:hypothetical protein